MQQAVGQEGSADSFHISLLQGALEATMSQDVTPPAPTKDTWRTHTKKKGPLPQQMDTPKVNIKPNILTAHSKIYYIFV